MVSGQRFFEIITRPSTNLKCNTKKIEAIHLAHCALDFLIKFTNDTRALKLGNIGRTAVIIKSKRKFDTE